MSPEMRLITGLAAVTLALTLTGCAVFLRDRACHELTVQGPLDTLTVDDPLLDVHFGVVKRPGRDAGDPPATDSLRLLVGHGGAAVMVRTPKNVALLRTRCGTLEPEDLAEVLRAVERLERSGVARRNDLRPGCRVTTTITLRDDRVNSFAYCGATLPADVIRFVEEISGRAAGRIDVRDILGYVAIAERVARK